MNSLFWNRVQWITGWCFCSKTIHWTMCVEPLADEFKLAKMQKTTLFSLQSNGTHTNTQCELLLNQHNHDTANKWNNLNETQLNLIAQSISIDGGSWWIHRILLRVWLLDIVLIDLFTEIVNQIHSHSQLNMSMHRFYVQIKWHFQRRNGNPNQMSNVMVFQHRSSIQHN